MDDRTREDSIRILKRLRDAYQGQLDTSVIVELEAVIRALESQPEADRGGREDWPMRALKVVADVIQIVTNISDFMR